MLDDSAIGTGMGADFWAEVGICSAETEVDGGDGVATVAFELGAEEGA
jgi:hypothetical protein